MRFTGATTKYTEEGKALSKGKQSIKEYKLNNPQGLIFDSKAEYNTYLELIDEQAQGKITNLQRQVPFELIPKQVWFNNLKQKKEVVRPLVYIADFTFNRGGDFVVVDCKGWKQKTDKSGKIKWTAYIDDVYKLKKKLFLHKYPQTIFEER